VPQTPDAPADPPLPAHQRTLTSGTNQLTTEQAIPAVSGPGQTERATADEAIRPLPETQAAITPAAITPAAITSAAITSALSNQVATAPAITPAAVSPQASASPPVAPVHTDTPPQPAAPLPAPAPPPAAAQLAPAFATLSASASGTSGTTPQSLVIRLAPVELGHVQVRIDQTADGTSHVVLAVERNDTLMLLLQDRPQLNQALDAAGISPDGRTLQLNLADPSTGSTPSGPGTGGTGTGSGSGSGGAGGGAQGQDNPGGGQRQPPAIAWQRAGVDITA
jgi:flagellar hook-length control protein FliK